MKKTTQMSCEKPGLTTNNEKKGSKETPKF